MAWYQKIVILHYLMVIYSFVSFIQQVYINLLDLASLIELWWVFCVLCVVYRMYMIAVYAAYFITTLGLVSHCILPRGQKECECIEDPLVIWHILFATSAQGISAISGMMPIYDTGELLSTDWTSQLSKCACLILNQGICWSRENVLLQKIAMLIITCFYLLKLLTHFLVLFVCITFFSISFVSESCAGGHSEFATRRPRTFSVSQTLPRRKPSTLLNPPTFLQAYTSTLLPAVRRLSTQAVRRLSHDVRRLSSGFSDKLVLKDTTKKNLLKLYNTAIEKNNIKFEDMCEE